MWIDIAEEWLEPVIIFHSGNFIYIYTLLVCHPVCLLWCLFVCLRKLFAHMYKKICMHIQGE